MAKKPITEEIKILCSSFANNALMDSCLSERSNAIATGQDWIEILRVLERQFIVGGKESCIEANASLVKITEHFVGLVGLPSLLRHKKTGKFSNIAATAASALIEREFASGDEKRAALGRKLSAQLARSCVDSYAITPLYEMLKRRSEKFPKGIDLDRFKFLRSRFGKLPDNVGHGLLPLIKRAEAALEKCVAEHSLAAA